MALPTTLQKFLADNRLLASQFDADQIITSFILEMQAGLRGQESSLAMIPSYISVPQSAPHNKEVIVLDAGGTNFRTTVIGFDAECRAAQTYFTNNPMPGSAGTVSKKQFFDTIVQFVEPVISRSTELGFCFSYPATIDSRRDGTLLYWAKEIDAPEVVGEKILENLSNALKNQNLPCPTSMVVLNDTVATLLAGVSAQRFSHEFSYIGFIVGTGSNISYVEQNNNITKISGLPEDGSMAINVESANFNKFDRGPLDQAFDQSTASPGKYVLEKMVSGGYLGGLCRSIVLASLDEDFWTDPQTVSRELGMHTEFETKDLNSVLEHESVAATSYTALSQQDYTTLRAIITAVVERAANLAAITIAAAVVKSAQGSPAVTHCITVDGSMYYKLYGFKRRSEEFLNAILQKRNLKHITIQTDNAPIMGAAVASLA